MPTKMELFNQLKIDIAAGRGLEDPVHLVNHAEERKRKRENPGQSTRVMLNCYSPEAYSAFQVQKDRYFTVVVDVRIAIDFMVRALAQVDDATLRKWLEQGHEPDPNDLPEWLRIEEEPHG
jgi:hypothetical protein